MGSKMSHDKRCSKPQIELFFRLFEAHHGGHLFVATKKWDERCAYALMRKEMIIRLSTTMSTLIPRIGMTSASKIASFNWHPLLRSLNRMPCFVEQRRHCSMASVLHIRFSTRCKCCCRVPADAICTNSLNTDAGGRATYGSSARLR